MKDLALLTVVIGVAGILFAGYGPGGSWAQSATLVVDSQPIATAPAASAPASKPAKPRVEPVALPVKRAATPLTKNVADMTAEVDITSEGTPISPYIYGGTSDTPTAVEAGLSTVRIGGNCLSTVNWKEGFWSSGADWYYVNNPYTNKPIPPEETLKPFGELKKAGLELYLTLPIMGRVAKDGISSAFDIRKYPDQVNWEDKDHPGDVHPNAGKGVQYVRDDKGEIVKDKDGKSVTKRIAADPDDTSIVMSPDDQCAELAFMIKNMGYGTADKGGLKFLCLDNEPMIWHNTHPGMHPQGCSYDEYWQRTVDYAGRVKKIDPAIQVAGPALFGWTAYFYSGKDSQEMSLTKGSWSDAPDFVAHGRVPFTKWWLKQLAAYEKEHGVRLVDILDWHFYAQWGSSRRGEQGAGQEAVVAETRVFWDPAWKDQSWMGAETGKVIKLVRLMKEWIAECNPGMKTCIGEYSVGGGTDISGGVAMAELLGVWGREGLDFAYMWGGPGANSRPYFAFKMFRNPDGQHTVFGDRCLPTKSPEPYDVSVHAAKDSKTGRLTFILINKKAQKDVKLTLKLSKAVPAQDVPVYEYSGADLNAIGQLPDLHVAGDSVTVNLPSMSVLRFDVKP